MKTAKIYDTCVDTAAIRARGTSPLETLIKQYGGWTVTGDGTNSWTVAKKMGAVLRDLNVQTLLSVSVSTDPQDSSQHILTVILITMFFCFCTIFLSLNLYQSKSILSGVVQQARSRHAGGVG